ncbi:hypothetical protein BDZ91DRAFT_789312 [Kalaharituber pfeilii]|nr:hypothetical protein BDZ91DRAFT_789312 [Kalaharituber pfeilii]
MQLISDEGRRVIAIAGDYAVGGAAKVNKVENYIHETEKVGAGVHTGYWCSNPAIPPSTRHQVVPSFMRHSAVVLTAAESETSIGDMTVEQLDSKIREFWNFTLLKSATEFPAYSQWLSHFIACKYDFGTVHAWVNTLQLWEYVPYYEFTESEPKPGGFWDLSKFIPSAIADINHELIDGVVNPARWESRRIDNLQDNTTVSVCISSIRSRPNILPRRIWDVCANKVIPSSWYQDWRIFSRSDFRLVSHSLVIPVSHACASAAGVSIEDVRMELVRHNIRYAWLDVLCLRQNAQLSPHTLLPVHADIIAARERRRLEEWATDVPRIGMVYAVAPMVVAYLNGLGRPFQAGGWDSERHWMRRAWTLQETKPRDKMIIAGLGDVHNMGDGGRQGMTLTPISRSDFPWNCKVDDAGTTLESALTRVAHAFSSLNRQGSWVSSKEYWRAGLLDLDALLREVLGRFVSHPVDRVSALAYLFLHRYDFEILTDSERCLPERVAQHTTLKIPSYDPFEHEEDAWARLVHTTAQLWVAQCHCCDVNLAATQLLKLFPHPSEEHWFPSWAQVMQYPDVSVKEPQLADSIPPRMDCSLLIYGGCLYRNVKLCIAPSKDFNHSGYIASAMGEDGGMKDVFLTLTTQNVNALDLDINPNYPYVLIDVTPACIIPQLDMAIPTLNWDYNLIIVCRELTEWRGIPTTFEACRNPYKYRLRRVTSLAWTSARDPVEPQKRLLLPQWLPFKATLAPQGSMVHWKTYVGSWEWTIEYCRETDIPTTVTGDDDSFSILLFFTLHSAVQVLTLHRRFPAVQSDADIESSGIWVTKIRCDKVGFDTMVKMCMANGKRYWRCKISKQNPKH